MVERINFGKLEEVVDPPNLIDVQIRSFEAFMQLDTPPARRKQKGLQAVLNEVFPVESYDGRYVLDFVKYTLGEPKTSPVECLEEAQTLTLPLHATFQLKDGEEVREEDVYMGDIPLMTEEGSFIINGAERVIVSQLHRSPGICFERSTGSSGSLNYSFRIIPDRGSWLDFQFDASDLLWIHIDRQHRRRKFLATTFLRALDYDSDDEMIGLFYPVAALPVPGTVDADNVPPMSVLAEDVIDIDSQTMLARRYDPVTAPMLKQLRAAGFKTVRVIDVSWDEGLILKSIVQDPARTTDDALKEIFHRLRPGDPATPSNARQLLKRMFMDPRRYDLGLVGRYKINQKMGPDHPVADDCRILDRADMVAAIRRLIELRRSRGTVDDIDHLGNRRVRTVGELLENQCRIGLARAERLIRERMTLYDPQANGPMTPQKLINPKTLSAVVKDFFGRSQLSQFMDQTNPLSALAHKRRLSALGPGGLSRERAGFDVRDVHGSHYGRICPIETPEGPNIGLISSLGTYSRINEFGFIQTPYRKVENGKVSDEVVYLSADEEEPFVIAQANTILDDNGRFVRDLVSVRYKGDFLEVPNDRVEYMDVSPKQVVSAAAGLIPFLEHDDANRALMGSNMMRQAVPLMTTEAPYVATGLERRLAVDSGVLTLARRKGKVSYVSAKRIVVTTDEDKKKSKGSEDEYLLRKFMCSNAGTCLNQKPIVRVGQKVQAGDVLADGPATSQGELALGKNVLVAFMPWNGYNFEDAILISERMVADDVFTSVHIEKFEVGARDTKLGPEEITRDIPNVGEDALANLGADGVVRIGAEVKPGDILVGKITPKSETELAPEERLLRAIFGEKAADVRDTSLLVPSGTSGTVMDVKITAHKDAVSKNKVSGAERRKQTKSISEELKVRRHSLIESLTESLSNILLGEKIPLDVVNGETGDVIIPANRKITKTLLRKLAVEREHIEIESSPIQVKIQEIIDDFQHKFEELDLESERMMDRLESGDDLDEGIIKQVRVYISSKKKVEVGDKMAGRHGNKGVVARILPVADMPFLPDGTPVDIALNPLGVPSRMNVGQVLETHLGWACEKLNLWASTPVFDGISEARIQELSREGGVPETGKTRVFDGLTGEPFDQLVVVGRIYIMKLHHLVSEKIHARAVGPYSLVTQQPLGGKAQYGGQRFGEMEVWALEAYGAAYALQELMTVKSDDVAGRTRIYESIVKGENALEADMPESFNVLINELRSIGMDVRINPIGER